MAPLTSHYRPPYALIYHFNITVRDEPEVLQKVSEELETFAADIRAWEAIIPFYPVVALVLRLPSRRELKDATIALLQWSRVIHTDYAHMSNFMEEVDDGLRLEVLWYFDHTGGRELTKRKRRQQKI